MEENIKNVLEELKKENDNLKQKLTQIEASINKTEIKVEEKIAEVQDKENIFPTENKPTKLYTISETINTNNSLPKANVSKKESISGMSIFILVLGIMFIFISKFIGIILLIGWVISFQNNRKKNINKGSFQDVSNEGEEFLDMNKTNSFELNVGIKWFQTIGIFALVLGVSFFIKYAIDLGWIGYVARVVLGFMLGISLIIFGHITKTKKDFESWSEVIMGGGIAICYYIGYMMYHVAVYRDVLGMTKGLDIFVLIVVSLMGIGIALNEQSQGLAAWSFGLIYFTFFLFDKNTSLSIIYLIIASTVAMILGFMQKWYFINFLGMIGSYICFGANMVDRASMNLSNASNQLFLIFIFLIHNIHSIILTNNAKDEQVTTYNNVNTVLNPIMFFLAGYFGDIFADFSWIVLGLSIFYLLLTLFLYSIKKTINAIHIFLSTMFLALFILIKADPQMISVFWSLLFVFIGVVYLTTKLKVFKTILPVLGCLLLGKIIFYDTIINIIKTIHSFDPIVLIKYLIYFISFISVGSILERDKGKSDLDFPDAYYWAGFIIGVLGIYQLVSVNLVTIFWLIYSFILITVGIGFRKAGFRLQGLAIMFLILLRVIFVDIRGLEPIYKTIVFIILGSILLAASYLYIKYQDKLKDIF